MSRIQKVSLRNGHKWYVGSWVTGAALADVIIPINQLDGMSDEEIGGYVRGCISQAIACHEHELEYNNDVDRRLRESAKAGQKQERTPKPGYVYLMHGSGTKWYKIGISTNPRSRAKSLGTKTPFTVEIIHTYKVPDMKTEEDYWHGYFYDKRNEGEWFTLSSSDIAEFVNHKESVSQVAA